MAYKNPGEWPAESGMTYESFNIPNNMNIDMTNLKTSILNAIMRSNTLLTSKAWRSLPNEKKDELIKNTLFDVAENTPRLGTLGFTRGFQNNLNSFNTNVSNAFKPQTWGWNKNSKGGRKMRKTLNKKKGKKMRRTHRKH